MMGWRPFVIFLNLHVTVMLDHFWREHWRPCPFKLPFLGELRHSSPAKKDQMEAKTSQSFGWFSVASSKVPSQ